MISAERILQIRKRLHLTQEQFAHEVGVTKLTVSRWETGETECDRDSALAVERFLVKHPEARGFDEDMVLQLWHDMNVPERHILMRCGYWILARRVGPQAGVERPEEFRKSLEKLVDTWLDGAEGTPREPGENSSEDED